MAPTGNTPGNDNGEPDFKTGSFKPAFQPGSQGKQANNAYRDQMGDPRQFNRKSRQYTVSRKRSMGKTKKILLVIFGILILTGALGGAAFAVYMNSINATMQVNGEERDALNDVLEPTTSETDPFYIMLIGTDGRDDVEGDRSDTNIVARVDPATAQVTLVSIPRDTAVNMGSPYGVQKFNAAYAIGGAPETIKIASALTGVPISHYVEVHFDQLIKLIDDLGGVEIDIPVAIDDPDAGGKLEAGPQTLTGEQALIFARSRAFPTGDFQRSENQRLLVEAILETILKQPATSLPATIQKLATCVTTDYSVARVITIVQQFQEAQQAGTMKIYSTMVPSSVADIDGTSYVIADTASLKTLMDVVDKGGDPSTVTITTDPAVQAKVAELTRQTEGADSLQTTPQESTSAAPSTESSSASTSSSSEGSGSSSLDEAQPTGEYDEDGDPIYAIPSR